MATPATSLAVKVITRNLAPPKPWPDPEEDDGSLTYSRSEVLNMIATTRAITAPKNDERAWALAMLAEYDATTSDERQP